MLKKIFHSQLGPLLALLAIVTLFAVGDNLWGNGSFLTQRNMRNVLNSASLIAIPAFGMTIIIIAAGIDLSAGTALTLCGTALAVQMANPDLLELPWSSPRYAGMLALTALVGLLCGFFNGVLISSTKVVPFIVTLGTMTIFLGIGQIIANESSVDAPHLGFPDWLRYATYAYPPEGKSLIPGLRLSSAIIVAAVLGILVDLILRFTVFGRNLFAVGSSEATARLCGINVPATIITAYTLAGLFVAVGGILLCAHVKSMNPTAGQGLELEIIAAVVLGGGSLSGGRGSIIGTMIGALIIIVIRNGCGLLEIPNTYTHIVIGCVIIIAVVVDQLRHGSPEWFFRLLPSRDDE